MGFDEASSFSEVLMERLGLLNLLVGFLGSRWAAWSLGFWWGDLDFLPSYGSGGVGGHSGLVGGDHA